MSGAILARESYQRRNQYPTSDWRIVDPVTEGLDSAKLQDVEDYCFDTNVSKALLVIRNGRIVWEHYEGFDEEDAFNTFSLAKSLTSMAVGAAMRERLLPTLDVKLSLFLPPAANHPWFDELTLRHCLTMQSGFGYPDYDDLANWSSWTDFVLNHEGEYQPGTAYLYKMDPTLVSNVVGQLAGQSMKRYFDRRIGTPLGLGAFTWSADPSGVTDGNGQAFLTARQMGKIGLLMASDGIWEGRRLLPRGWIAASSFPCFADTRTYVRTGLTESIMLTPGVPTDHGLLWWCRRMSDVDIGGMDPVDVPGDSFFAFGGAGGQFIAVMPSLDIVVCRVGSGTSTADEDLLPGLLARVVDAVL